MTATPVTVSQLTALVGDALGREPALEDVLVEGEITNLTRPSSGHLYFTLKDRTAQLGCVCFRANALRIPFAPANGLTVVAHGQVTVYSAQGRYQLMVDRIEPSGIGGLALAVEQRRRELAAEGLFDERLKRPLPLLPARVAVVTSRTGAALHDVLTVMARRAPCVEVVLSPATVQGDGAAATIVQALRRAGRVRGVDAVLLVRGGGSLEDLMAFNEKEVARAIRACPVPVVTGVGHETDLTIADLAADRRAATPSAAAETAVPSCERLRADLSARRRRLRDSLRAELAAKRLRSRRHAERLEAHSPARRIAGMRDALRARDVRLGAALRGSVAVRQRRLERACGRLELHSPARTMPARRARLDASRRRMDGATAAAVAGARRRLEAGAGRLEALSPLRVLDRGYSITAELATGRVLTAAAGVRPGTRLRTRLADGSLVSAVVADPDEGAADG